jgi:hypothetical protein
MTSLKREIVSGIFGLLQQWWVWAALAVGTGFLTGTLTQRSFYVILDKIGNIL